MNSYPDTDRRRTYMREYMKLRRAGKPASRAFKFSAMENALRDIIALVDGKTSAAAIAIRTKAETALGESR